MFQKLLGNKHLRLRDSRLSLVRPSGDLGLSTRKKTRSSFKLITAVKSAVINKKLLQAYNRAFTKNDEAGLEMNRFYICRYVVAINEKGIYRFSVCVSDYILCIAWVQRKRSCN